MPVPTAARGVAPPAPPPPHPPRLPGGAGAARKESARHQARTGEQPQQHPHRRRQEVVVNRVLQPVGRREKQREPAHPRDQPRPERAPPRPAAPGLRRRWRQVRRAGGGVLRRRPPRLLRPGRRQRRRQDGCRLGGRQPHLMDAAQQFRRGRRRRGGRGGRGGLREPELQVADPGGQFLDRTARRQGAHERHDRQHHDHDGDQNHKEFHVAILRPGGLSSGSDDGHDAHARRRGVS